MSDIFKLIAEVGFPIVGALVMGYFIFLTIKQMLAGVVGQIQTLTKFCVMLEDRARTMSNEMIKIDLLVSLIIWIKQNRDFVVVNYTRYC